ncbi:MAG: TlyA family RNA methyltransferase [Myxococcota bacterium]|nr:TlyA family RNA methyltransferase [Myxococcota bacterium]
MCELGLCATRQQARALVLAGEVEVDGQLVRKAGAAVPAGARICLRRQMRYVSRGGLKLEHALAYFGVDVRGATALDVGAATGGFTDCLLQAGARAVCAVDVGYGQLAWKLRCDPRVVVLERTNARYLDPAMLPFRPDLAVCDVSFISQTLLLPRLRDAVGLGGRWVITLVKPQFEVGRGRVGRGGVVRDAALRLEAVHRCAEAATALGFTVVGYTPSPLLGPAGNQEFLLALRTGPIP